MLIDTHCHLDAAEFDADRDRVVDAAIAAGVGLIVVPAVDAGNFATVRALAHSRPGIAYALGIHPMYVDRARDDDLASLGREVEAAIADPRFVGIGEIGLDHFVPGLDRDRQLRFFEAQLALAAEFGLPVILHLRRAQDAILKQLRRYRPPGGIAHSFNGSAQQAGQFVDLGFALGFGGAMTFDRALRIRGLAASLPARALVVETDAPDIPPAWLAGGRNEPAETARICAELAALRGESPEAVRAQTGANALRVLPRLAGVAPLA
ncbi:TatD family hydrolase [Burkholderiaceae bacterium FT117]|uniref:TatD family hydrolase n=1 Tax=Zeimonas sediminis TaxID=2944268 RepID=UPI002342C462|nr:TatD family hydrolase [Zeimonas sediminis]MCM5568915.1 TatD family hydrolase [Zeimonas sediminis]